jgi:hypothetical protein
MTGQRTTLLGCQGWAFLTFHAMNQKKASVSSIQESGVLRLGPYHSITLPDHDMPGRFDSVNMSRQELFDLVSSVPADQSDLAWDIIGVDDCADGFSDT